MYIAQTLPYSRLESSFTDADRWGANVASHDLIRALLNYGTNEGVHFFLDDQDNMEGIEDASGLLQQEFPGKKIEIFPVQRLAREVLLRDYVIPIPAVGLSKLILTRNLMTECAIPLTGLIHTVPDQGAAFEFYLTLLLCADDYDSCVVSSGAGFRAVTTILEALAEYLAVRFGTKPEKRLRIEQIPFGVERRNCDDCERIRAREALDIPTSAINILYLGRFSRTYKADLEPLLITFSKLARRYQDIHLTLAGKESSDGYAEQLRELAKSLLIDNHVTIHINFPLSAKRDFYLAADMFVSPADNIQETFGLSVLDAMSYKLPVIASRWSGYSELIEDFKTGFLIDCSWPIDAASEASPLAALAPGLTEAHLASHTIVDTGQLENRMALLIDDRTLRHSLGAAGRQRALEAYSVKTMVNRYQSLFQEQMETIRATGTRRRILNLDYTGIFGHFATHRCNMEFYGSSFVGDSEHLDQYLRSDICHIEESAVRQVFNSVNSGCGARTRAEREIVSLLIKKGLLRERNPIVESES